MCINKKKVVGPCGTCLPRRDAAGSLHAEKIFTPTSACTVGYACSSHTSFVSPTSIITAKKSEQIIRVGCRRLGGDGSDDLLLLSARFWGYINADVMMAATKFATRARSGRCTSLVIKPIITTRSTVVEYKYEYFVELFIELQLANTMYY